MASAFRILGEGQLSLTKFLLVTDRARRPEGLPRDARARARAHASRRPISTCSRTSSMDTLDYTGPVVNEGIEGRLARPRRSGARAAARVPPGDAAAVGRDRRARVLRRLPRRRRARRYADDPGAPARLAAHPAFAGWPLVVLSDEPARATRSVMNFLWTTFTRFEPAADIHAAGRRIVRNHIAYEPPIVIDARMKPWYPKEVTCRDDIARTRDRPLARVLPVAHGRDGRCGARASRLSRIGTRPQSTASAVSSSAFGRPRRPSQSARVIITISERSRPPTASACRWSASIPAGPQLAAAAPVPASPTRSRSRTSATRPRSS